MTDFLLVLFSKDPSTIIQAVQAGVRAVIVDWEHIGKKERQFGVDTEINRDTTEDLKRVRACTKATVICRINSHGDRTEEEIEAAANAGADEILLPMVRTLYQVENVIDLARRRCGVGILVETVDAIHLAPDLGRLPLSRVYVGLNDMAIDRKNPDNIFLPIFDGTVERLRRHFPAIPFGFGGLTTPDGGFPLPCRLLMAEMVRLGCSFSFLRRTFHRDMKGRCVAIEIPRILDTLGEMALRSRDAVTRDKDNLDRRILSLSDSRHVARKFP